MIKDLSVILNSIKAFESNSLAEFKSYKLRSWVFIK